ncbi:MAG: xanthine dehydrogenase family protein subunit M [Pseudorhodoplanes sp.]|nr:6-hydroxypseudooxynicotine dehydrogenase complex subunit alpha [Pseudorhodoplanes sp.]MBW7948949.1 xanthine dehydrogenase family protein subunit M [Pseudorhodoplanes sp.]GIK82008.1 MAG: molybdopterin dehydrogenase [Alphaproteobacteria bacterium]
MKPAPFAYAKARSVEDALRLLREHGEGARLLAGGQSLIATLNMRLSSPAILIDLNEIAALSGIALRDGDVVIGAMTRHAEVQQSDIVASHAPLVAAAMPHVGHAAIRNRGTIGGSIAFADPAAELPACLLALGGRVEIAGATGTRMVAADDYFRGLYETAVGADEVLTAIRLPAATPASRFGFLEFPRRHGDYAMAGLAATARADGASLKDVRLAYFGVGMTPVRARKAEAALAGGDVEAAVTALVSDLDPPDDIQASGAVKRHLAGVLLRRVTAQMDARIESAHDGGKA